MWTPQAYIVLNFTLTKNYTTPLYSAFVIADTDFGLNSTTGVNGVAGLLQYYQPNTTNASSWAWKLTSI